MNPGILLFVSIGFCYAGLFNLQKVQYLSDMEKKIDKAFHDFQNETFLESDVIHLESGWYMKLPSGRKVTRSFLIQQADSIIKFGKEAVPYLYKWVMNDELYIRYIAIYSLQQITGLEPNTPFFDNEDLAGNREQAIRIWNEWYAKHKDN